MQKIFTDWQHKITVSATDYGNQFC